MRTKSSVYAHGAKNPARRVLKRGQQPDKLPIPRAVRQRQEVEAWRERIWQARYKFLVLLHPQYRELVRKLMWSMDRFGMNEMPLNLTLGLFSTWVFTGSVAKMQDFVEAIWTGHVFLMDPRLLGIKNAEPNLSEAELRKKLCLYFPHGGMPPAEDRLRHATAFAEFLGPFPPSDLGWPRGMRN